MTMEAAGLELADQDVEHHSHDQEDDANGNTLKTSGFDEDNGSSLIGLSGILEALLFVSGEPLSVDRLVTVLDGVSRAELIQAVRALQAHYSAEGRGLQIVEIAGGYQITTRLDCAPWIKRLEKAKAGAKLSRSAMETLAIIAYKQPLVRTEIEQIRGVDTAGVLRTLLDRRLIRIVGRKDMPGRPIMYGTTKQFLQSFGLKDLADLPALRDIKELSEPEQPVLPELSLPESIAQE